MENNDLCRKIAFCKGFVDSESFVNEINFEIITCYNDNNISRVRDLAGALCVAYEKFYSGYKGPADALDSAMFYLDIISGGADFILGTNNEFGVREFYKKAINFPKNFCLN